MSQYGNRWGRKIISLWRSRVFRGRVRVRYLPNYGTTTHVPGIFYVIQSIPMRKIRLRLLCKLKFDKSWKAFSRTTRVIKTPFVISNVLWPWWRVLIFRKHINARSSQTHVEVYLKSVHVASARFICM